MKNLKNYFILALITLTSSAIFFACSSDNEQLQESKSSSKVISTKKLAQTTQTSNLAQTTCDITGTTVVSSGNAVVTVGSSATYSYVNNTGTATNIVWTISPNPAGSATITSNGLTVTVTYLANFISGTLSAAGSGGTAQTCNTILNITKSGSIGNDCSCTPIFANEFYNVPTSGGGPVENAIYFANRTTCAFDWITVSSVKIQIGGVFGVGSNSSSVPNINTMGQTGGMANNSNWTTTPSGFRNIKIRTHLNASNVDPGFLRNNTLGGLGGWATITFNNGCPDVILYLNDDQELSPIN
jgi:hypothetical protein